MVVLFLAAHFIRGNANLRGTSPRSVRGPVECSSLPLSPGIRKTLLLSVARRSGSLTERLFHLSPCPWASAVLPRQISCHCSQKSVNTKTRLDSIRHQPQQRPPK